MMKGGRKGMKTVAAYSEWLIEWATPNWFLRVAREMLYRFFKICLGK